MFVLTNVSLFRSPVCSNSVLQYHHDHPVSGHFGINKTLALICRDYVWPNLCSSVTDYCISCTTCSCSKSKCHKPYGLFRQLPILVRPWDSISMDFIEQLPPSSDDFTATLVVVDRFTKQSIFIPMHDTITSAQLAELFVIHVFSKHGVPCHVTSDRGSEFVSHFFRSLGKALDMKLHFTSRYHLEGDGQTEREFAYNNALNTTTGVSPFFANKGYDPAITIHPEYDLVSTRAHKYVTDLNELYAELRNSITLSQEQYQCSADKNQIPLPDFKVGDQAFIKAKFFQTTRPLKKLLEKYLGLFNIIAQAGPLSWTLRLPDSMQAVHPIFRVSVRATVEQLSRDLAGDPKHIYKHKYNRKCT